MSVSAEPTIVVKPRWRGRIHQGAFFVSLPAGAALVAMSRGATARVAAICFALSLAALFGTSAAYHRENWTPRVRSALQRADHAMIFVLIAGSYTPITLLAMRPGWGIAFLALVWTIAVVGVTLALSRFGVLSRIGGFMYIGMGWLVIVALPMIVQSLGTAELVLMLTGGVLYTLGAIGLSLRRPDPSPALFGYHEVWHVMTVAGATCHFALVALLVHP